MTHTPPPTTRAEAAEAVEKLADAEHTIAEHVASAAGMPIPLPITTELVVDEIPAPPEFLPLAWRRVLFLLGLLGLVTAPLVSVVVDKNVGEAIELGANMLAVVGLGTALANPTAPRR